MEANRVLNNINFLERYLKLSSDFSFELKDSLKSFSNDKVIDLIKSLGYEVRFFKREDYFSIVENISTYRFQFNLVLKGGFVEFIWGIWANEKPLESLSGPWGLIAESIGFPGPIRKPIFRDYTDLSLILKTSFEIYDDLKRSLLELS